jgi:hypothetical protein
VLIVIELVAQGEASKNTAQLSPGLIPSLWNLEPSKKWLFVSDFEFGVQLKVIDIQETLYKGQLSACLVGSWIPHTTETLKIMEDPYALVPGLSESIKATTES